MIQDIALAILYVLGLSGIIAGALTANLQGVVPSNLLEVCVFTLFFTRRRATTA